MIVIPAIDLKEGKCVRLLQGQMDQETVYSEDPIQMANHWESKGAKRLHVVDLNGAVAGKPVHDSLIGEIVKSVRIPVEVGGGIRDLDTIERYLAAGVAWVILGTGAYRNRELVEEATARFPQRVILSVDARKGKVAIQGWKEVVATEAMDFIRQFEALAISAFILTDIERDGTGAGLNWELTRTFAETTSVPLIASGGISHLKEIERLKELEAKGVVGVIIGRALYARQIDLEEAIRAAKGVS
jgi:phosphoribosylformimino-5-aminoimidazole carboxamide ribotide isomerase